MGILTVILANKQVLHYLEYSEYYGGGDLGTRLD
jgi:hypothetical protein